MEINFNATLIMSMTNNATSQLFTPKDTMVSVYALINDAVVRFIDNLLFYNYFANQNSLVDMADCVIIVWPSLSIARKGEFRLTPPEIY